MKLSNVLMSATGLIFCFAFSACGGSGGNTLTSDQQGLFVGVEEYDQNDILKRLGEGKANSNSLQAECDRLKALSNSGTFSRIDVLKFEANGTVRAVYFNRFGLFDPTLEPVEIDDSTYILGRIANNGNGNQIFKNTQPAFGKTTVSDPNEDQVITANKSIQRTDVEIYASVDSETIDSASFTTDTVGSFGVENRATFEYRKVSDEKLGDMMFTIQLYCAPK
jgi:hypothetical protein